MNDIIEAISCEREIIQLKLLNVPKHPKMIAKIFSILKDEEINVDMNRNYFRSRISIKTQSSDY